MNPKTFRVEKSWGRGGGVLSVVSKLITKYTKGEQNDHKPNTQEFSNQKLFLDVFFFNSFRVKTLFGCLLGLFSSLKKLFLDFFFF